MHKVKKHSSTADKVKSMAALEKDTETKSLLITWGSKGWTELSKSIQTNLLGIVPRVNTPTTA